MSLFRSLVRNPLWPRLSVALAACALLPLGLLLWIGSQDFADSARLKTQAVIAERSSTAALGIGARVEAANAVAVALLGREGLDLQALNAAAVESGVFLRVIPAGASDVLPTPVLGFDASGAAGSALITLPARHDLASVFLLRRAQGGSNGQLYYLELSPQWLWRDLESAAVEAMVLDARGTVLFRPRNFPSHAASAMAANIASREPGAATNARADVGWTAEGNEWSGAVAAFGLPRSIRMDTRWHVATAAAVPMNGAVENAWRKVGAALLGLGLAVALGLSSWLTNLHRLSLIEVRGVIQRLGRTKFQPLQPGALSSVMSPLIDAVNTAGVRLADDMAALQTLSEIDRLLLGATELEPVLDAILAHVTTVTRCQTVGIALIDSDSPALGRVYCAADGAESLPVTRIELDPELIATLAEAGEGVTIARCEDERHSFLKPQRALGSEFFWVWPVMSGTRLAALLAVGFQEAPRQDPRFARYGSEFASRLATALSKTARDERLYRQAHYDPLTSLPNRLLFRDRLSQELANSIEARTRGALLYIDLDYFKKVNDTVGHAAGDQLLIIIAQRLRACVKEGDTVARLAGDEFTVVLRNVVDPEAASLVAERIIESIKMPVNLAGRDHYVQASIGMALFPDGGQSIDDLMRRADGAMYRAKDMGRGRAVFFDRSLMMKRYDTTQSGLHRALRQREFSLFYQPQYSLKDGSLVGLEALLRWQTARDGMRCPDEFIPAAEVSGLIVDIGGWVLEAACAQLSVWREQGIAPRRVSVNVSVQQLKQAEFPRSVRRVLDKYGIPPDMLEIEITESVLLDEVAGIALRQLSEQGLRIALDDFGTGYSSLNYLRQRPINVVKIDRSFLEDVPENSASATLAETIISMAHALGKEVVAEGVETSEQLEFLRERGCDSAQGFFLAQPMPAAQVGALLQAGMGPRAVEALLAAG